LELLYDYTKFHIGLYLSITSAFVAVASVKRGETFAFDLGRGYVWLAVVAFMVAGFAGGVIASSITQCLGLEQSTILQRCSSAQDFLAMRLGPMEVAWFYGRTWTQIEHVAFWIGLVLAAVSFLTGQPAATAVKAPLEVKVSGPVELRNVA
jgi:hypothetical protein